MKNTIKVIALIMTAAILCLALASCGKTLSGTYESALKTTELAFKGSKVEIRFNVFGIWSDPVEGEYSIDDDKITFEFSDDDEDAKAYNGTFSFEESDDYIKIGTFGKFTKKA